MQNNTDKLIFYKERDIGQMMGLAANLIRMHYKHMFRTIGIMTLPLVLMASTLNYLASVNDLQRSRVDPFQSMFSMSTLFSYLAIYLAYCAILWGCVYYVKLYEEKGPENFTWNDIWAKVFKHGWQLLFTNMLVFLIIGAMSVGAILLIFTVILSPVSIILLLGLAGLSQLWTVTYLYEEAPILEALDRSFKMMKKQWWKNIGLLICSYFIVYGFVSLPGALLGLIGFGTGSLGAGMEILESTFFLLAIQNFSTVVSFFSTFFLTFTYLAFYFSNKERLGKVTLKERVAKLAIEEIPSTYS